MKPNILTRERLAVIVNSIEQHGGAVTIRHLMRNHGLHRSVIDEAIDKGFVTIEKRQGPRGRPSHILKKVSKSRPTKLPPRLLTLEDLIRLRHWMFAFYYTTGEIGPGFFDFKRRAWVAYRKAYPTARSKEGARASASRLLRRSHIRAAIAWTFAKKFDRLNNYDNEPKTESEIWTILFKIGSFRTRWAPWHIRWRYEQKNDS